MTGDAMSAWPPAAAGSAWPPAAAGLTEPAGGVGRAIQAGAQTLLLDQEFDSATLYALRAAVQAHACRTGLSEDRAEEVVLAVHELAANAIAHGAGHGRLRMWDLVGTLTCEIVDSGSTDPDNSRIPADADGSHAPANTDGSHGAANTDGSHGAAETDGSHGAARADNSRGAAETADPWPVADGHGLWLVRRLAHLDLRSGPRGTRAVVTFARSAPEDP